VTNILESVSFCHPISKLILLRKLDQAVLKVTCWICKSRMNLILSNLTYIGILNLMEYSYRKHIRRRKVKMKYPKKESLRSFSRRKRSSQVKRKKRRK
jgi:hypothetical protein